MAPRGGTYDFTIYCATASSNPTPAAADADASSSSSTPPLPMALQGGGGGEGHSGVPNKLVVAALDLAAAGETGLALSGVPGLLVSMCSRRRRRSRCRRAVHPRSDGALVAFPSGCRSHRTYMQKDRTRIVPKSSHCQQQWILLLPSHVLHHGAISMKKPKEIKFTSAPPMTLARLFRMWCFA
ncbi:hypothetical protein ACP70R_018783 [Stipagrostis hirtigluma subsp. patula]